MSEQLPPKHPEGYEVENYEGNPAVKIGGHRIGSTFPRRPKRVKWKRINLYGWIECQTCGFVAATDNGRNLHEKYEHSPSPTELDRVYELDEEVTEMLETFGELSRRTPSWRIFGPNWWRNR